jgi:hypothetical protein
MSIKMSPAHDHCHVLPRSRGNNSPIDTVHHLGQDGRTDGRPRHFRTPCEIILGPYAHVLLNYNVDTAIESNVSDIKSDIHPAFSHLPRTVGPHTAAEIAMGSNRLCLGVYVLRRTTLTAPETRWAFSSPKCVNSINFAHAPL